MRITVLSIGKVKQEFIRSGEREYLKRLPSDWKVAFNELGPEEGANEAETIRREGAKILKALPDRDFVVVLDERGRQLDSREFADQLQSKMVSGVSAIAFVIGGAYGVDEAVRKRAGLVLSLSKFTFPYQLARLVLIEQLYRAVSLIKGLPYHK